MIQDRHECLSSIYISRKVGRNRKWEQQKDPWFDTTCFKYWTEQRVELDWCILQLIFSSSTGIVKLLSKHMYCFFLFFPKSHVYKYQLVGHIFISAYPSRMSKWSTNHLVAWNDSLCMILGSKSLDKIRQVWTRFGGVLRSLNRFENRWTERRKLQEYEDMKQPK